MKKRLAAALFCFLFEVAPAGAVEPPARPRVTAAGQAGGKAGQRQRRASTRPAARRPIGAVLFDLDGTLADSEPLIARVQHKTFNDFGYRVTLEQIEALVGTPFNSSGSRPGRLQILGIPEKDHAAIEEAYRTSLATRVHETPKVDHADGMLRKLERRRVPSAIVSNKEAKGAESLLTTLGWRSKFKVIIGHGTPGAGVKPDAQPTLLALSRLGVAPEDAAFVGDSPSDMTSGAKAGVRLRIGLLTPARTAEELYAAGATHVVASLRDVERLLLSPPPAR